MGDYLGRMGHGVIAGAGTGPPLASSSTSSSWRSIRRSRSAIWFWRRRRCCWSAALPHWWERVSVRRLAPSAGSSSTPAVRRADRRGPPAVRRSRIVRRVAARPTRLRGGTCHRRRRCDDVAVGGGAGRCAQRDRRVACVPAATFPQARQRVAHAHEPSGVVALRHVADAFRPTVARHDRAEAACPVDFGARSMQSARTRPATVPAVRNSCIPGVARPRQPCARSS